MRSSAELDLRVIASTDPSSTATDDRFRLLEPSRIRMLDGVLFYLRLPFHVRREIIDFGPEAIIAESPYTAAPALVGRALARGHGPQVVIEVHGDWRTATRLYGAPSRRFLSPIADAVGRIALRRGDAVRALSSYTEGLVEDVRGIPVTASFEAYMDLSTYTAKLPEPLPRASDGALRRDARGVQEHRRPGRGLAARGARAARGAPRARRQGHPPRPRRRARRRAATQRRAHRGAAPRGRVRADGPLDVLVLPSRSEGLGRVLVEAMARGRDRREPRRRHPDVARDDREALLVTPGDVDELPPRSALSDWPLAERLGRAAFERYQEWHTTPAEYARASARWSTPASARRGRFRRAAPRADGLGRGAGGDAGPARSRARRAPRGGGLLRPRPGGARRADPAARDRPGLDPGRAPLARLPRSALVLRADAVPRPPARPALPAGCRDRRIALHRLLRPARDVAPPPRPSLDRRRDARRLAHRVPPGRLAPALPLAPIADWAARYALRHADALRALSPFTAELRGPRGRGAAGRVVPRLHRPRRVHGQAARADAAPADGPLRRDARALEGRYRAPPTRGGPSRSGFPRLTSSSSAAARSATSSTGSGTTIPGASSTSRSCRRRVWRSGWTPRRSSSCPRGPRVSAA